MEERRNETGGVEKVAVHVSPEAWAEFEALDVPGVWDEEDEALDVLEDEPYVDDEDDFGPTQRFSAC